LAALHVLSKHFVIVTHEAALPGKLRPFSQKRLRTRIDARVNDLVALTRGFRFGLREVYLGVCGRVHDELGGMPYNRIGDSGAAGNVGRRHSALKRDSIS
jgi:hypothetical protein